MEANEDGDSEISYGGTVERRVSRIKIRLNDVVQKGQVLILLDAVSEEEKPEIIGEDGKIKATDIGSITSILVKVGEIIQPG